MKKYVGEVETINHNIEYVFKDDGSVELQIGICKETGKESRHYVSTRKAVKKTKNKDDETEYYIVSHDGKMEKKLENVREL